MKMDSKIVSDIEFSSFKSSNFSLRGKEKFVKKIHELQNIESPNESTIRTLIVGYHRIVEAFDLNEDDFREILNKWLNVTLIIKSKLKTKYQWYIYENMIPSLTFYFSNICEFVSIEIRRDIFNCWLEILKNVSRDVRRNTVLQNHKFLTQLIIMIFKSGHFLVQRRGLLIFFKYLNSLGNKYEEILNQIFSIEYSNLKEMLHNFNIRNFEMECRKFLNYFNMEESEEMLVYSLAVNKGYIEDHEIYPPKIEGVNYELWIDFNMETKTISFKCSSRTVFQNIENDFSIIIEAQILKLILNRVTKELKVEIDGFPNLAETIDTDEILDAKYFTFQIDESELDRLDSIHTLKFMNQFADFDYVQNLLVDLDKPETRNANHSKCIEHSPQKISCQPIDYEKEDLKQIGQRYNFRNRKRRLSKNCTREVQESTFKKRRTSQIKRAHSTNRIWKNKKTNIKLTALVKPLGLTSFGLISEDLSQQSMCSKDKERINQNPVMSPTAKEIENCLKEISSNQGYVGLKNTLKDNKVCHQLKINDQEKEIIEKNLNEINMSLERTTRKFFKNDSVQWEDRNKDIYNFENEISSGEEWEIKNTKKKRKPKKTITKKNKTNKKQLKSSTRKRTGKISDIKNIQNESKKPIKLLKITEDERNEVDIKKLVNVKNPVYAGNRISQCKRNPLCPVANESPIKSYFSINHYKSNNSDKIHCDSQPKYDVFSNFQEKGPEPKKNSKIYDNTQKTIDFDQIFDNLKYEGKNTHVESNDNCEIIQCNYSYNSDPVDQESYTNYNVKLNSDKEEKLYKGRIEKSKKTVKRSFSSICNEDEENESIRSKIVKKNENCCRTYTATGKEEDNDIVKLKTFLEEKIRKLYLSLNDEAILMSSLTEHFHKKYIDSMKIEITLCIQELTLMQKELINEKEVLIMSIDALFNKTEMILNSLENMKKGVFDYEFQELPKVPFLRI